jgi:hypothetical protein
MGQADNSLRDLAHVARPAASVQWLDDGKVLPQGIVANPRTGPARKYGRQDIGAGRRRGDGSHRCTVVVLGSSGGQGNWPCLRELLRSGWVPRDLHTRIEGG